MNNKSSIIRPQSKQKKPTSANLILKGVLFEVWQWEQTMFDGKVKTFETLRRPDTVLVLPILYDGSLLLSEEQQPGTVKMLHTIGGRIEDGETPEEAAHRELLEETGYIAKELRLWDAWQPVNKIDWAVYLFIAHGVTVQSDANLDSGEKISLRKYPVMKLFEKDMEIELDDNEFLFKLYYAQANSKERDRVIKLLTPPNS